MRTSHVATTEGQRRRPSPWMSQAAMPICLMRHTSTCLLAKARGIRGEGEIGGGRVETMTCTKNKWLITYGGGGGEDMRRLSRPRFGLPLGRATLECARNWMDGRRASCTSPPTAGSC